MVRGRKKRKSKLFAFIILLAIMVFAAAVFIFFKTINSNELILSEKAGEIVSQYAEKNGIDYNEYPENLIALLSRNSETKDFVLSYPKEHNEKHKVDMSEYKNSKTVPLFMQWDKRWGYIKYSGDIAGLTGCGPVCLSMAAYYLTKDENMSPDKIIEFAQKNGYALNGITEKGSQWTLISEGGERLGLDVTELPLDENRIIKNLEAGNPIICSMGPGDFTSTGHFIVLVGYENGKIKVNDPNSIKNSKKEWTYERIKDQIRNLWAIRN